MAMPIFSRLIHETVEQRARRGPSEAGNSSADAKKIARNRGMSGHVKRCPVCFDVVAIDELSGEAPVVRSQKNVFNPKM
jgi:hypothetical protein